MNSDETKIQLRRSLLKKRVSLPQDIWQQKSQALCNKLQSLPQFQQAKTVLAYFSFRQEPDLSYLFSTPKKWGLPRCVGQSLIWHLWQPEDSLQINKYGIQEPTPNLPIIQHEEVDLILVPAVACDYQGYRLGYGGGFYDRLLSLSHWQQKNTIGIVFDFAYLPQLPVQPWDCQLDYICID